MTTPASTCSKCTRPGLVSEAQLDCMGNRISPLTLRFVCPKCLHEWNTNRREAELTGRFLARAGLS